MNPSPSTGLLKRIGLLAAPAALVAIVAMPTPAGLPLAGQMMLGILAFAVTVWMTEALAYGERAVARDRRKIRNYFVAFCSSVGRSTCRRWTNAIGVFVTAALTQRCVDVHKIHVEMKRRVD